MKGTQLGSNEPASFYTDLKEANELETRLKEIFETNYNCTVETAIGKGSFPDYDLKVYMIDTGDEVTIEVKQDKQTVKTKHVAVEYQRTMKDGTVKPTCISTSKADFWVYYFMDNFYIIATDDLRKMVKDRKWSRDLPNAGDGNRASIYLFHKDVFISNSTNLVDYITKQ